MKRHISLPKLKTPLKFTNKQRFLPLIKSNQKPDLNKKSKIFLKPIKKYKLKPINLSTKISLLLLGATGDGKSQLGNFILNNPSAFKVSDDIKSETKETIGAYGINGSENIFVIDTPGLQDTEENDKKILSQMADYVKNHKSLHSIIIVLNFTVDRLSAYIQEMLKIFVNMFPIPNFWDHVCFVFTHYYAEMIEKNKLKKQNKIDKFSDLIHEMMENFKSIVNYIQIPEKSTLRFYFVDTEMDELEDKDKNSVEEINRLIKWASNLETFEADKIQKVDNKVLETREEYQTRQINSTWNKNIEIIHYVKEKRLVEKFYSGKESFKPWEIIENFTKEVYHTPEIVSTNKKWKQEKSSEFNRNIENIKIQYYYKIIEIYNDGTEKEGNWIFSHEVTDRIEHPKRLEKTEIETKKTFDIKTKVEENEIIFYTYIKNRTKKIYNDLSVEYTDWEIIDTNERVIKMPPRLVSTTFQQQTKLESIGQIMATETFSIPGITIDYDRKIGDIIRRTVFQRPVELYSDNSIIYGNWTIFSVDYYNNYY